MKEKEKKASPELMKFFSKLLDLKRFIGKEMELNGKTPILLNIYDQLDSIIKEKK